MRSEGSPQGVQHFNQYSFILEPFYFATLAGEAELLKPRPF